MKEMENQEKAEGEKGNVEMSSPSHSRAVSTPDPELVRQVINNHLVSCVIRQTQSSSLKYKIK